MVITKPSGLCVIGCGRQQSGKQGVEWAGVSRANQKYGKVGGRMDSKIEHFRRKSRSACLQQHKQNTARIENSPVRLEERKKDRPRDTLLTGAAAGVCVNKQGGIRPRPAQFPVIFFR